MPTKIAYNPVTDAEHVPKYQPPSRQLIVFIYQTWHSMVRNTPLANSGHLSQLCSLTDFYAILTSRGWDGEKSLTQGKQQNISAINIMLIMLKSKTHHRTIY